ncbi:MAG: hypothetical protein EU535_07525 [Promethearchaeota archaeon]|nr:MAG: hypothetical protein EU535_07525 [Candidatus Lokiarchaeota archaeon]
MTTRDQLDEGPKIVVMNIDPVNIENCINYTIHGAKTNTAAAGNVEKLNKGDICLIRRTSGGGRYRYGVIGIWYFVDYKDIEDQFESLWTPPNVWKYKIYMHPLVKRFETPFSEDFSKSVEGQLRHKESSKVDGLQQVDIQGAVRIGFYDPDIKQRYLRAILEEKGDECKIQAEYEDDTGINEKVNVYEFLSDIINYGSVSSSQQKDWRAKGEKTSIEYWNLDAGEYLDIELEEEEIWQVFMNIYDPSKSSKTTTYKFALIYSILKFIEEHSGPTEELQRIKFKKIFNHFTQIYWKLIIHYDLQQITGNKISSIYRIIMSYLVRKLKTRNLEFRDINPEERRKLIEKAAKYCSRNVFGALYGDSEELFYSFDLKDGYIELNPYFYNFLKRYNQIIDKVNNYEWLKFLVRVNPEKSIPIDLFIEE